MDGNPVYARQSKLGQTLIKEVIRTMLEQGFLTQTKDKYALLKLTGKSEQLLESEEPFPISYRKEEEKNFARSSKKKSAQTADLTEKGRELFEELRKLRAELAKKRSVPPYVVASDKTLRDMCLRIPFTEAEMLNVNGMGEKKVQQYGAVFMEKLMEITGGDREAWGADMTLIEENGTDAAEAGGREGQTDGIHRPDSRFLADGSQQADGSESDLPPLTEKRRKGKKEAFHLTEEILAGITYSSETTISDFVAMVNELRDDKQMKRLTIKSLTEELLEEGSLEVKHEDGYTRTVLTEKGKKAGIRADVRMSAKGNPYEVMMYSEMGQRHLVELMKKL